ncbi:hypothetical protein MA16_Dca024493 [Dendrobium catenatum]|uniref:Uncharacterized protein n=1 Tax=Dendrobium catenatum TaxID=906689 RepID=A0A2I0VA33_9ASPA|nr:hypothetical protein MA16_Dca024493 [Dendrobium catenatum]
MSSNKLGELIARQMAWDWQLSKESRERKKQRPFSSSTLKEGKRFLVPLKYLDTNLIKFSGVLQQEEFRQRGCWPLRVSLVRRS